MRGNSDKWKWSESIILTAPHTSPHFSTGEIVIGDICLESGKKTFGDLNYVAYMY